jgi:hypothetical protein
VRSAPQGTGYRVQAPCQRGSAFLDPGFTCASAVRRAAMGVLLCAACSPPTPPSVYPSLLLFFSVLLFSSLLLLSSLQLFSLLLSYSPALLCSPPLSSLPLFPLLPLPPPEHILVSLPSLRPLVAPASPRQSCTCRTSLPRRRRVSHVARRSRASQSPGETSSAHNIHEPEASLESAIKSSWAGPGVAGTVSSTHGVLDSQRGQAGHDRLGARGGGPAPARARPDPHGLPSAPPPPPSFPQPCLLLRQRAAAVCVCGVRLRLRLLCCAPAMSQAPFCVCACCWGH